MKILSYSLGQMRANCYLLLNDKNCLIIDPGDEADFLLETIQRQNLKPVAILATHGHFDHVMAVGEVQRSVETQGIASLPLYIHKNDLFLLKRAGKTAEHFLEINPYCLPPTKIENLKEGPMEIDDFKLEVIFTPGHTPGSCCFYFKDEQAVFTGDTLFKDGIGRYDFGYSSKKDLDSSLKKIKTLPEDTIIYPGHGEETIISACHS